MWKRFQTVLIAAAAILLFQMFWMEMCHTQDIESGERFAIFFHERIQFLLFTFTTFMLSTFTIFYFKKRILQMRLCLLTSIMLGFYQLWILAEFFLIRFDGYTLSSQYTLSIAAIFPVIAIILLLTSMRLISKDEVNFIFSGSESALKESSAGTEHKNGRSGKKK
ncbi:MAG: DUF4293 family protein [Bacteroidales bacterium]|nr:DUF4293 family protein [Candidatus Cacconaster merdequi]